MLQQLARKQGKGKLNVKVNQGKERKQKKGRKKGKAKNKFEKWQRIRQANCDLFILSQERC